MDIIQCLIHNHGATVLVEDVDGLTPLHLAMRARRLAMVQYLVIHGADPNLMLASTHDTPLLLAAQYGNVEMVRTLLNRGAPRLSKTQIIV